MPALKLGEQVSITNGPGKWDLILALFDGSAAAGTVRHVTFTVGGEDVKVFITMIEKEDGSGESWNFQGSLMFQQGVYQPIRGWFSTKNRQGYIISTV